MNESSYLAPGIITLAVVSHQAQQVNAQIHIVRAFPYQVAIYPYSRLRLACREVEPSQADSGVERWGGFVCFGVILYRLWQLAVLFVQSGAAFAGGYLLGIHLDGVRVVRRQWHRLRPVRWPGATGRWRQLDRRS